MKEPWHLGAILGAILRKTVKIIAEKLHNSKIMPTFAPLKQNGFIGSLIF